MSGVCRIVSVLAVVGSMAHAQVVEFAADVPSEDRWNYPFNFQAGAEFEASSFGATLIAGFDDYDGQVVLGWSTSGHITPGLGVGQYHVERAVVRVTVSNDLRFTYDPTGDSYTTFLPETDAEYVADVDAGRPVELWGVGYRFPMTLETWTESAAFGGAPVVPPAEDARFAFASFVDGAGADVNVSRRVRQRFDAAPFATGASAVAPGELVPANTEFMFEVDLCAGGAELYLSRGLDAGVVRFSVASLSPATGGPGGGSGNFPRWYMKENPTAQALGYEAKLELTVRVGAAADISGSSDPVDPAYLVPDGTIDASDFFTYLDLFVAGDSRADVSGSSDPVDPAYGRPDCVIDAADFFYYLDRFVEG